MRSSTNTGSGGAGRGAGRMLAYEAPNVPEPIIQRHDEAVKHLLASQVTNADSRGYGTLEDPRACMRSGRRRHSLRLAWRRTCTRSPNFTAIPC